LIYREEIRFQNEETYFRKYAKDRGLSFKEIQGFFSKNAEPKGYVLILSVDPRMDGCHRFRLKEREGAAFLLQRRPVAAMAGPKNSPENSGFPVSDHDLPRNQHQSKEKVNANTSTRFR
jgi:hypothetical protein